MSVPELACLVGAAACFVVGLVALRVLRTRLELVARAEHELRGPATALGLACQRLRSDPAAARHADVLEAQLERLRAGLEDLAAARGGRSGNAVGRRPAAAWAAEPAAGDASFGSAPARVDVAAFVRAALEPWRQHLRRCSIDLPRVTVSVTDRGRLAQAVGNLLANSAEHGAGDLRLRARRVPGAVRLEVRNGNRAGAANGSGVAGGTAAVNGGNAGRGGARGRGLVIADQAARELGGRLLVHTDGAATVAVLELPDGRPSTDSDPVEPDAVA